MMYRMKLAPRAFVVIVAFAGASASVYAQTMIASSPPNGPTVDLFVVDPTNGTHRPYMSITVPLGRELRFLTALPDHSLAGSLSVFGSNTTPSLYIKINPATGTSTTMTYGAPVSTLNSEGVEFSPRHNGLLLSFGPLGDFNTNRLALINPLNGAVISSTGALPGISDMDTIVSTATEDIFFDLNASSGPRVKHLTTLMPTPTFSGFASPPEKATPFDAAINPTNGDIWFIDGDGARLVKLVDNTYVNGPILTENARARGLAFAYLPPRALAPKYAGICPGHTTSISVLGVGTDPLTYKWYKDANPINPYANPSAETVSLLIANAGPGDEGNYHCEVTNDYGSYRTADIPFMLCRADLNCDAVVDDEDFTEFVFAYNILVCTEPGMPAGCPADLNLDGFVDDADFTLFIQAYNRLLCSY